MSENNLSFEDKLDQLEKIVDNLEKGDSPLESSMENFKQGVALSQDLQKQLGEAEQALTKIISDDNTMTDFTDNSDQLDES